MTDAAALPRATKSVLLVDWPSRDVLASGGFTVTSNDGPDEYNASEAEEGDVRVRSVGAFPDRADLAYTHRRIEVLSPYIADAER